MGKTIDKYPADFCNFLGLLQNNQGVVRQIAEKGGGIGSLESSFASGNRDTVNDAGRALCIEIEKTQ